MNKSMSQYKVNDLPLYSDWPLKLLGMSDCIQMHKSKKEILREFEKEKWGQLLLTLKDRKIKNIDQVNNLHWGKPEKSLVWVKNAFFFMDQKEAHKHFLDIAIESLFDATSLVELGCGYGSVLFGILKKMRKNINHIYGLEYTKNGVELTKRIAQAENISIIAARCDLSKEKISKVSIPIGSTIYTSHAVEYIPILQPYFVDTILHLKPQKVVHFEPIYEHCESSTIFGLLRKKYIEVNDYNRNLLTLLKQQEKKGKIQIKKEIRNVFGSNPLFCVSIIEWVPL